MTDWAPDNAAPPVSPEDHEASLWAIFRGDQSTRARSSLFSFYAPIARQIARRHFRDRRGGDVEYPDLCQLAYAGLLEAIDRFDPGRGSTFKGFASRRIGGSILDGLTKTSEVRQQASYRNRMRAERTRSLMAGPAPPSEPALADALKAFEALAIGIALGLMLEGTGLYQADEAKDPRASAYESLAWAECVQQVRNAVAALPEREQAVIRSHYLDELDFGQIALMLGVGKARVSQLHRAGLVLLRAKLARVDFRLER